MCSLLFKVLGAHGHGRGGHGVHGTAVMLPAWQGVRAVLYSWEDLRTRQGFMRTRGLEDRTKETWTGWLWGGELGVCLPTDGNERLFLSAAETGQPWDVP